MHGRRGDYGGGVVGGMVAFDFDFDFDFDFEVEVDFDFDFNNGQVMEWRAQGR